MVTKNQIKLVISLQQKKYRSQHGLFVVEGKKTVRELLDANVKVHKLYVDDNGLVSDFEGAELVSSRDLKTMSSQTTPSGVLGVFHMPKPLELDTKRWVVALDAIRDPGNLGTIIRLCDWFGIRDLVCSYDTVDCYNPKVLQATMGSIARVNLVYVDLEDYLKGVPQPVYGTFMDGDAIYGKQLPASGILVMGNEANGISGRVAQGVSEKVAIPQFGKKTAESLNVATATAIFLSEIRRGN